MASNSFGDTFRVTTWGESHGPALGCTVDGVPPQLPLSEADIQPELDRRRPGQSRYTTQRKEADEVQILSGVFEGLTTGAPVSLVIWNSDQRSKDYSDIKDLFRPGHADYTYWAKYGHRDYRGGGRQSARETAMRVAAGAIARKVLAAQYGEGLRIRAALVQLAGIDIDRSNWDWAQVDHNDFFSPDDTVVDSWALEVDRLRKSGSSAGAVVEVVAEGLPAGLGEPIYDKLDGDLARAMMTINAVKGVEIGNGFEAAATSGVDNADEMRMGSDGQPYFLSNHNGGTLGGISTGQPLVCRFAVKPTSSILTAKKTVDKFGQETTVSTKGRHDPCVGIRAVPIGEAMMALVLADHALRARASAPLGG